MELVEGIDKIFRGRGGDVGNPPGMLSRDDRGADHAHASPTRSIGCEADADFYRPNPVSCGYCDAISDAESVSHAAPVFSSQY